MRPRLRDLGITIGDLPIGPENAITDVPGVEVGHSTIIEGDFAAWYNFSGNGEMTGLPWIEESGLLGSPIGLTNTHQVGLVRDHLVREAIERGVDKAFHLPVVADLRWR